MVEVLATYGGERALEYFQLIAKEKDSSANNNQYKHIRVLLHYRFYCKHVISFAPIHLAYPLGARILELRVGKSESEVKVDSHKAHTC